MVRFRSGFPVGDREDIGGGFGPDKRHAAVVPGVDEGADRVGDPLDGGERGAADGLSGDDGEERLDQVHPGRVGRGEVQVDPRMLGEPLLDVGVVVGRVVVDHDVQLPAWVGLGDHLEELQELDATVAWVARIGHFAGRDLQRGEQRGGPVTAVVV